MSLNRVMLIGRIGQDPTTKDVNGKLLATFSVATSKKVDEREYTEWHRCKAWGKTAEFVSKYLGKGRQVYVEGELQTRKYDKDGQTHYTTEVSAFRVEALGPRLVLPFPRPDGSAKPEPEYQPAGDDSDVPF